MNHPQSPVRDRPARILIVDDDPAIRCIVAHCLEDAGYDVVARGDGVDSARIIAEHNISLAVLDIGLPGVDGLTLTRQLRVLTDVGIIILSGRDGITEKIIGLEVGADDYLAKPFEPRELLARVRSVLRRLPQTRQALAAEAPSHPASGAVRRQAIYRFSGWTLDPARRSVSDDDGRGADLTSGEFDLLEVFVEHPNRVLSRNQLMDYLHGNRAPAFDRSIDVRIRRLRQKIEVDPNSPELIKTVRHAGYMFAVAVVKDILRTPEPAAR